MQDKIKISAVSYLNTIPFVYGLTHHSNAELFDLSLDVPSECARKLRENEVDIALVPVAEIALSENDYQIISDYCIGANGAVKTVILASDNDISKINRIYLDPDSMTSVQLLRILAKEYWKIQVEWVEGSLPDKMKEGEAALYIGDKAFKKYEDFTFVYDLAEEWLKHTKLPFVFACWVSKKSKNVNFKLQLNDCFELGLAKQTEAIKELANGIDFEKAQNYLSKYIQFDLNAAKLESLKLFLAKCCK